MKRGFTLIELVIMLVVVAICVILMIFILTTAEKSRQQKCKNNLKQMGYGQLLYSERYGRCCRYPDRDGSLFLCRLYITGVSDSEMFLNEPGLFLCPSTRDTNKQGKLLTENNFINGDKKNVCSYAGRKNRDQDVYPGIFKFTIYMTWSTMASDDWGSDQGDIPYNHPDVAIFLYFSGHTGEWDKAYGKLDKVCDESTLEALTDPLGN